MFVALCTSKSVLLDEPRQHPPVSHLTTFPDSHLHPKNCSFQNKCVCKAKGNLRARLRLIPSETALDLPPEEEKEKALGKNVSLGFV